MHMNNAASLLLAALAIGVFGHSATAHAQGFPGLPEIKVPKPSEFREQASSFKKLLGAGTGCVVGGALGVAVFKRLDHKLLEEGHSEDEVDKMGLMAAGIGCVIGGAAAVSVINGMDERSKQKQEEAWAQALANGNNTPVRWEGPRNTGYSGNVSFEKAEPLADGTDCITRKDYVVDGAGQDATAYNRYCKNAQDEWEQVAAA